MPQFRDEAGNVWEGASPDDPNLRLVTPAGSQGGGVVLPAAPPEQPVAPGRTPAGAATEGAPKGFAWIDPNNPSAGVYPIGGLPNEAREGARPEQEPLTAKARVDAEQAVSDAQALYDLAQQLKVRFNQGPGSTSGIAGLGDYLPTESNRNFNDLGQQARGLVKRALGFTGGEGNTATESSALYDPFLPKSSDLDGQILQKITALEELAKRSATMSSGLLGKPLPEFAGGRQQQDDDSTGALDLIRTQSGGTPGEAIGLADSGTTQFRRVDDPALARAHDELVQTLLAQGGGRLDPNAYAAGVAQLAQAQGYQDNVPPEQRAEWARAVNDYLASGGRTVPTELTAQQIMSAGETARNNLANNPVGGFLSGAGNAATFGAVEAALPGQYAALGDAQGGAQFAGEVAGAVAGTGGVGAIGRGTIGRVAPSLLQGNGRGQFLRNVAADATYGGAFGGVTEGDPLTGAVFGAGGSAVGQGLGRGLGAAVGGAQRSAAVQALRDRGVPISVGRQLGAGRVEDLASSIPFVGDAVRARQLESFEGFNEAALREAGGPIGFQPTQIGAAGVADLGDAVSDAYTGATRGVTAPIDTQTFRDLRPVTQAIRGLPDDYRGAAETILDRRVLPTIQSGNVTGEQYQQALRGIKQARANAGKNPSLAGFEQEFRDALTGVEDMLTGTMTRGAGPEVAANLGAANAANRGFKTVEDAALNRANVGTQAGQANVFTPAQLLQSARASERKGFGDNPLMQLGREGQEVLPSTVPNSGTGDRILFAGALGGAGLVGGGAAGTANDPSLQGAAQGSIGGVGTTAGAITLASLLGTRRGQQVLEQILFTRPQAAQRVGQGIRRRSGLFGSTGSATALQAQ